MVFSKKDIDLVEKNFITKDHFEQKLQNLKSDIINKLDSILKEILA